jgi:hypothetical protein
MSEPVDIFVCLDEEQRDKIRVAFMGKKHRKKPRKKREWCPGCGYPYRGTHCTRCGGE